jgi:hypothetical protein
MNVNMDELHAGWLAEYERAAWSYCESVYGEKPCTGAICKFADFQVSEDDDYDKPCLEVVMTIKVPCGTDRLIRDMARFSKMSVFGVASATLTERQNASLITHSFCLHSLLQASYPRNPKTMRFKGCEGACCVLELGDVSEEKKPYCAFCGIGVMLLAAARKSLAPMATDEAVLDLSDGIIFGIIDGGAN